MVVDRFPHDGRMQESVSRATGASGAFDANEYITSNRMSSQAFSLVIQGSVRISAFLSPFG